MDKDILHPALERSIPRAVLLLALLLPGAVLAATAPGVGEGAETRIRTGFHHGGHSSPSDAEQRTHARLWPGVEGTGTRFATITMQGNMAGWIEPAPTHWKVELGARRMQRDDDRPLNRTLPIRDRHWSMSSNRSAITEAFLSGGFDWRLTRRAIVRLEMGGFDSGESDGISGGISLEYRP